LRTGDPGNKETRQYLQRVKATMGDDAPPLRVAQAVSDAGSPSGTPLGDEDYEQSGPARVPKDFTNPNINVNLDTPISVSIGKPDMDTLADDLLEQRVGSIVDEVLDA
jgi:hypothetical protein